MKSRYFFGAMVILIGVIMLLQNLGFMDTGTLWHYIIPLFMVGMGLSNIIVKKRVSALDGFLVVVGELFLCKYAGFLGDFDPWKILVPGTIILIGARFIFKRKTGYRDMSVADNKIEANAFFSGSELVCSSNNFEYGDLNVAFGGIKVDLRNADTNLSVCHMDVNAVFGGIEIIVPEDWGVLARVTPVFGGCENRTVSPQNPRTVLTIAGSTLCGGIEIYNKPRSI
ncbi:MAG: hypothetical protein BWY15_01405 [Firmicutes bacterium ADurb.Bin193]|nr:MAG: hypothetical protein BWY15_01405 [Firmicutes bacterium ADurb.Bin193]